MTNNGLACYTLTLVINFEDGIDAVHATGQLNVSWKSNNDDHIQMPPAHFSTTFTRDSNTWVMELDPTPPSDETLRVFLKMSDLSVSEG